MNEFITGLGLIVLITLLPKVIYYVLINAPKYRPCKNPLVEDTNEDRFNEWVCRTYGCVTTARHYVGMPQATCRRCGHKNPCAQTQIKEWRLPDRYDK